MLLFQSCRASLFGPIWTKGTILCRLAFMAHMMHHYMQNNASAMYFRSKELFIVQSRRHGLLLPFQWLSYVHNWHAKSLFRSRHAPWHLHTDFGLQSYWIQVQNQATVINQIFSLNSRFPGAGQFQTLTLNKDISLNIDPNLANVFFKFKFIKLPTTFLLSLFPDEVVFKVK